MATHDTQCLCSRYKGIIYEGESYMLIGFLETYFHYVERAISSESAFPHVGHLE